MSRSKREVKDAFRYSIVAEKKDEKFESVKISSAEDIYQYAIKFYDGDINLYESMFMLLLDRQLNVKGWCKISQGGVCSTSVDMKIIAKYVADTLASAVVIVHNHPSGNLIPSIEDIAMTKKAKKCLEFLDSKLLDSIIITDKEYKSIIDEA